MPKALLPVANKEVLYYVLELLEQNNLKDLIVVCIRCLSYLNLFFFLLKFEALRVFVLHQILWLCLCFVIVVCILKLVIVFVRGFLFSSYFLFEVRSLKVKLQLSV